MSPLITVTTNRIFFKDRSILGSDLVKCDLVQSNVILSIFFFLFSVCPEGNWGDNCTQTCSCITANTRTCDRATGTCDCLEGWTGDFCEFYIDECSTEHECPDNSACQYTNGSFYCQCNWGYLYRAEVHTCQGIYFIFEIIFIFFHEKIRWSVP